MKFGVKVQGDNRNINVQIGAQKEEGEKDFFDFSALNDVFKIEKVEDDMSILDEIESEENPD